MASRHDSGIINAQPTEPVTAPEPVLIPYGVKFNGKNFSLWSQFVMLFVTSRGKKGYLTGSASKPPVEDETSPDHDRWEVEDAIVKGWLIGAMEPDLMNIFIWYPTAKHVWDAALMFNQTNSDAPQVVTTTASVKKPAENNEKQTEKKVDDIAREDDSIIASVHSSVFQKSEILDESCVKIVGYDFNQGVDWDQLLKATVSTGFQATNFGEAIQTVNHMLEWRLSDEPLDEDCSKEEKEWSYRESVRCKVFLSFTSNIISSGLRETVRYLAEHKMVDVIVTTAGGIEEDLIKCLAHTYKGDFSLPGADLRAKGVNRIGNLTMPNDNYCKFENWINPILDQMLAEQLTENMLWTPSKVIARLGKEINNPSSYLYWAYKNKIPVFCPGLTDGSIGDMLHFHSFRKPGLVIDIVQDIRAINGEAIHANPRKTGMIILGGGLPKHHTCNANMMRNGADYAVYINTAQEFDGSDSGASPDEAVSWGKIRASAMAVKVHCDATIAFPLLVAETFAKKHSRYK